MSSGAEPDGGGLVAATADRGVSPSMSALAARVASVASAAAAGPSPPVRASSASISLRRFENRRNTAAGMPAISAESLRTGRHATPSRRGELVAQRRLNTAPAVRLAPVQGLSVERRPASVGTPGEVGDQHMGVQLRVTGPAGAMPEPGGDEPAAGQPAGPEPSLGRTRRGPVVRAATHETRLPLQPRQRRLDRGVGRLDDLDRAPADRPTRTAPTPTSGPRT